MARPMSETPTEVELEILSVCWERGPSTLRDVHDVISAQRETSYSSTRKMIQVMCAKGLLIADSSTRPQLYDAAKSQSQTQRGMLDRLVDRAFDGSKKKLLMSLLADEGVSAQELVEMQKMISQAKRKRS